MNFNSIKDKCLNFFKSRGIAFYLLIPVVILSFIVPFVYNAGLGADYYSAAAFALPFLAVPVFAAAFFKPTARYAATVMFVLELVCLILFVDAAYMQLAKGFLDEGDILSAAGPHFIFCVVAYLINIILSAAAMFFKQYRNTDIPTVTVETEEAA